ncbi:MAG TPA: glycosyltransferase family 39 protein [Conexibacter sp.]|nr:glycosyltransferase family 39 protein [Conexibacter sp.]
MEAAGLARAAVVARRGGLARRVVAGAPLVAIVAVASALRLWSFGEIAGNPFYDAAVRSMSQSWHNLFFGAFDPGAMSAVDKAPLDLWLQVASVKLFGFSSTALRLPEVIGGIAAVVLVYDLGRRLFGREAGLAAATVLAVLPASVLTARSDTMDAVMMAFVVLSAWCVVRAAQDPRAALRWMVAAGTALGIAFNVKLAEALLPLPALLLLAGLGLAGGVGARLRALLAGGAAFAAVALSWLVAVALAPGPKPFPIGSTDGTAWNVVLVFDGTARLGLAKTTAQRPGSGPLTLFGTHGAAFGVLVGSALLGTLIAGGLAVALDVRRGGAGRARLPHAGAVFVVVWLVLGVAVFSRMSVVYARYLDALAPALALALGAGAAALAAAAPRRRLTAAMLAVAVLLAAAVAVPVAHPSATPLVVAGAAALALAALALRARARVRLPAQAFLTLALAGLLAVPAAASLRLAGNHTSDGGEPGAMPAAQVARLSAYLAAHRAGARYQLAVTGAAKAGPLIARDGQRVLILTTAYGRPLVTPHQLAAAVRGGQVRYLLTGGAPCVRGMPRDRTGCAPAVRWAMAHGRDVSHAVGVPRGLLLHLRR